MSSYSGRRGPNVSEYIANLNTIPSPSDQSLEPQNLDDDFALFTNSDFTDAGNFNMDVPLDFNFGVNDQPAPTQTSPAAVNTAGASVDAKMDFTQLGDFSFADLPNFSNPMLDSSFQDLSHQQGHSYPVPATYTSPVSAVSPGVPGFDAAHDEAARVAAEEDKRRRNTAASARFRIKKKQREQTLEKTAKEMSDRVSVLETRIQQLETENAWLKGLITEKSGGKTSTSEIKALLTKHEEGRSTGTRTDGVGTKA